MAARTAIVDDRRLGAIYNGRTTVQVDISTRHGHLSTETQQKISRKIEKLAKFHERIRSARVILDLQDEQAPDVEVRVSVARLPELVAHSGGNSLWGAVDGALHKIEDQLRKKREKSIDRRTARHRDDDSIAVDDNETEEDEDQ